ncbi:type I polyketide synthase [Catenuloplanes indicus]|uniref:Acyl transferase domain-containing protein n=1 Tax=Catenuloplanes indicus TaxID=137267 RepID=A0AAE3W7B3_9ACTN|nr:beta-ketoacyl synthase N-terminal-like domain-containing protein [Catenuloplanes indicus]MDQ0371183.1 acyl transferase domain-containing protein [Catenuloplanes indicus]
MTAPEYPEDNAFIAVIGMAGRFPGAADVDAFWHALRRGDESVRPVPAGAPVAGFTPAHGVLDGADEFDADHFGYAPNEAMIIDPQQRLFLECAHEALERAGYGAPPGRGRVGVFAGGSTTDYRAVLQSRLADLPFVDEWQLRLATAPDFLATRAAYKLGLHGPAVAVQTACSTSLVAVHLAMQALLAGECDTALAGGAAVHVPHPRIAYTEGGILSPDGHCRAFDADARGTVGGSAVAVVLLKPLSDALRDGDHVHAVLRGSAINNDGAGKVGFTAPSVAGQARVVRAAHLVADVDPDSITYVEAHGTGTPLGDPVEIAALTEAFRRGTQRRGYCAIGSVKTNIGHTDAAAGVTGLIKTVLAAEHGYLPPSLHFRAPNPEIDFAGSPFVVNAAGRPWEPDGIPRRAGVNALGVGGTNAHVIVEQPPARPPAPAVRAWHLLPLSARTPSALAATGDRLAGALTAGRHELSDVAWTLQTGRAAHPRRTYVVARDAVEAAAALRGLPAGPDPESGVTTGGAVATGTAPEVVFLFPGQGSQHVHMGRGLYEQEPVFRRHLDECARAAEPVLGFDLRAVLYPPAGDEVAEKRARDLLGGIETGQPAVFAVEYALLRLLTDWGVTPTAVAGHSLGAFAAACAAGVLSGADAARLVATRGMLLGTLPAGTMLAVRQPEAEVAASLPPGLTVAAVNGPGQCTVSGPAALTVAFAGELARRGVEARVLPIATAGHSPLVEPILDTFRQAVESVTLREPAVPLLSDTSGDWAGPSEVASAGYWARHLRAPVRFDRVLSRLGETPDRILLEIGPGRTLSTLARQHPGCRARAVRTLPHPAERTPEQAVVLAAVGELWSAGVGVRWPRMHEGRPARRVVLPTYPFERRRYLVSPAGPPAVAADAGPPLLNGDAAPSAPEPQEPTPGDRPADPVEAQVRTAFRQALGVAQLTGADDFFELGGDSITATKLAAWARGTFGVPVSAVHVLRTRTAASLAAHIRAGLSGVTT